MLCVDGGICCEENERRRLLPGGPKIITARTRPRQSHQSAWLSPFGSIIKKRLLVIISFICVSCAEVSRARAFPPTPTAGDVQKKSDKTQWAAQGNVAL